MSTALEYHLRTRHAPYAYARALPYMDWETQPDPFRRYEGAPIISLERQFEDKDVVYDAVLEGDPRPVMPLDWSSISWLFFHSLALSAWKEAGDARWSLRVNPSSGNLHPTECYLIGEIGTVRAIYHYQPLDHSLECRALLPEAVWRKIAADLPRGAFLLGLTSIPLRESWKYGERAFRYCQHDLGHAIATVSLAAAALGWKVRLLESVTEERCAELLGIATQAGPEAEFAETLLVVYPGDALFPLAQWKHYRLPTLPALEWVGTPARLASDHHAWPVIGEVTTATRRLGPAVEWVEQAPRLRGEEKKSLLFSTVVRQRRSAVEMDGTTTMRRADFLRTMRRLLPGAPPFEAFPGRPAVVPFVFVHRVVGLEPGLYVLARGGPEASGIAATWDDLGGCLFRLRQGDLRGLAQSVSCGQAIAGDGAFAVAMLCDLEAGIAREGEAFYRRAHWEAGAIGQILYLEAERDGLRGTGIGCFYDEETHRAIGLPVGSPWRTIYHFTVGGPVEDPRLRTVAAYPSPSR